MFSRIIDFFKPPEYESIEQTQKARFLHVTLLVTTCASIILGIQNIPGKTILDIFLFILAGLSFICIPFNKRGYYTPVAIFISIVVLGTITLSLIQGIGLRDAGVMAYPLFIIFTSFLFSKRASFIITMLSIVSVSIVYIFERSGHLAVVTYSEDMQFWVIFVMLIAASFFLWVYMDNWERILKDLKDTYDLTLIGWGQALEYRDRETEGHSQRVVKMTVALAKRLGVAGKELDSIRRGALLHDIGKMAVPDSILLKTSSLTEEEWKVVKMHPMLARNLLEHVPFLRPALDVPYSHHERWNGSGYPDGLAGQDIPMAARIFAVVDVWDTLISDRPYRQAWPADKVREYIQAQSGILFDPHVVDTFLAFI